MSEDLQSTRATRSSRERSITSCLECRRRKQRCNLEQPCSNCARRYPQPPCEYKENRSKTDAVPNTSTFAVNLNHRQPHSARHRQNVARRSPAPSGAKEPTRRTYSKPVSWSGTTIQTQFPSSDLPEHPKEMVWARSVNLDLPICSPDCSEHSETFHKAVYFFKREITYLRQKKLASWDNPTFYDKLYSTGVDYASPDLHCFSSPRELLHSLPVAPTLLHSDLLQIYIKLMMRFKVSVDGRPDMDGVYHKKYLPFCIQNPLLVRIVLYTAGCFLGETGVLDHTTVMLVKGQAISVLNNFLRSEDFATSDEAIAAVCQLIIDEWYWGETRDLKAHLIGLRQMVKMRGISTLGMHGIISKQVLVTDFGIAIASEVPPLLQNEPQFEYEEEALKSPVMSHNSPFIDWMPSFVNCQDHLELHPATASILDDIRFLIRAIIALPARPSIQNNAKVQSTARWIQNKITALPADDPDAPETTPSLSTPSSTGQKYTPVANSKSRTSPAASDGKLPPAQSDPAGAAGPPRIQPDFLYKSIRLAALLYTSAITVRQPLSQSCSQQDVVNVWMTMWRVPLSKWRSLIGIFLWLLIAVAPKARLTGHSRFAKSMFSIASLELGLVDWNMTSSSLRNTIKLQAWLNQEEDDDEVFVKQDGDIMGSKKTPGSRGGKSGVELKGIEGGAKTMRDNKSGTIAWTS